MTARRLRTSTRSSGVGRAVYPFSAIVGQEEMTLALMIAAVDPLVGGVLMMGHRGTGKSTAVRGLAELLPPIARVKGCRYGCDPTDPTAWCEDCRSRHMRRRRASQESAPVRVVDLPLGATEDRVCGALNVERAIRKGVRAFEPGLLAQANRGFLYIDEVNLLEDHLVDLLLDVAATGWNIVEREGISVRHPARFVLIGSGNPEEGDIRPQLLDRFGLSVKISTIEAPDLRADIVRRRQRCEADPAGFNAAMEPQQAHLRELIVRARQMVGSVVVSDELLRKVVTLCGTLEVAGHRGELAVIRAAKAAAALDGRSSVTAGDIEQVAPMCLRHRLRREALGAVDPGARVEQALREASLDPRLRGTAPPPATPEDLEAAVLDGPAPPGALVHPDPRDGRPGGGGRVRQGSVRNGDRGRYVRAVSGPHPGGRLALDATLRAAAPLQLLRGRSEAGVIAVAPADLRFKQFRRPSGILAVFVVDASGSMAANRISLAKGALMRLLSESYVHRDKVSLVAFRGRRGEVLLPPSRSVERARRAVEALKVGDGTPLAAGLQAAVNVVHAERTAGFRPALLVLFTDGGANVPLAEGSDVWGEIEAMAGAFGRERIASVVIDTTVRHLVSGRAERLAQLLGGRHVLLPAADPERVHGVLTGIAGGLRADL